MVKAEKQAESGIVRLRVNINQETAEIIRDFTALEGQSATETVRRAISLYAWLMKRKRVGRRILIANKRGRALEELVIFPE